MPELPEVEVTRRGLAGRMAGARIVSLRLGKPLRWPLGVQPESLLGLTVREVGRRGKYLLLELDQGVLLLHLGMSGSIRFDADLPPAGPHDHFDLGTDCGVLRLHDPRRFGAVVYVASAAEPLAHKLLGGLGVEPLSPAFQPLAFHAQLQQRRAPIKQVLLAGAVVVGVGNIYASEALFRAGIRPTVGANRISRPRAARLHTAIQDVLSRALEVGGSSLRNFANADGGSGHFQLEVMVYGRVHEDCRVCATPIEQIRQGQRSSYFCPCCQKP